MILLQRKINIVTYMDQFWIIDYGIAMLDLLGTRKDVSGKDIRSMVQLEPYQ